MFTSPFFSNNNSNNSRNRKNVLLLQMSVYVVHVTDRSGAACSLEFPVYYVGGVRGSFSVSPLSTALHEKDTFQASEKRREKNLMDYLSLHHNKVLAAMSMHQTFTRIMQRYAMLLT
jgi:hypothetical protein